MDNCVSRVATTTTASARTFFANDQPILYQSSLSLVSVHFSSLTHFKYPGVSAEAMHPDKHHPFTPVVPAF